MVVVCTCTCMCVCVSVKGSRSQLDNYRYPCLLDNGHIRIVFMYMYAPPHIPTTPMPRPLAFLHVAYLHCLLLIVWNFPCCHTLTTTLPRPLALDTILIYSIGQLPILPAINRIPRCHALTTTLPCPPGTIYRHVAASLVCIKLSLASRVELECIRRPKPRLL